MPGLLDLRPVLVGDGRLVLAELLLNRFQLLAQEVLALLLLGAALHVVADPAADLQLGQPLALELDRELEPLADVERLQQLDLLLVGQVGGVAGGVGQGSRLGDRAQEGADAVAGLAQLEDLLDDRAVLALEGADVLVAIGRVLVRRDLDAEGAVQVGAGGAGDPAVEALERGRAGPAREGQRLLDAGDRADRGELLAGAGDEQDLLLGAGVDRQREVHARGTRRRRRGGSGEGCSWCCSVPSGRSFGLVE